jgi:hypothetical protein
MATFNFDPASANTISDVKRQIVDAWNGSGEEDGDWYVVIDDAGPCVIAAFAFNHHARTFVRASGEEMYVCDGSGTPDTA